MCDSNAIEAAARAWMRAGYSNAGLADHVFTQKREWLMDRFRVAHAAYLAAQGQEGEAATPVGSKAGSAREREAQTHISSRRTEAIGAADDAFRVLWSAIYNHRHGSEEQQLDGDEDYLLKVIKDARGGLAEWRPS